MTDEVLKPIADSATAFLADHGGPARARLERAAGGIDVVCWQGMAELGWFGIDVPETAGGMALGPTAACVVAEAAGNALLTHPLTMAMAAASLLPNGGSAVAADTLQALLSGRHHVSLVQATLRPPDPASPTGVLMLDAVPDGDLVDAFVVALGDGPSFEARLVASSPSSSFDVRALRCVDGTWLGFAELPIADWSECPLIDRGESGEVAWNQALALFRLGDAAYCCGLMAKALAMSLDYLGLRRQFGVPIGTFQALQHRAVDAHVAISAARALVTESARGVGERAIWGSCASVRRATAAALAVTRENIQFHGAIGFADEHDAGLYLRRAMTLAARHGSALDALRSSAAGSPTTCR